MHKSSLSRKFIIIFLLLMIVYTITMFFSLRFVISKHLTDYVDSDVRSISNVIKNNLLEKEQAALSATTWFENSSRLASAVLSQDRTTALELGKTALEAFSLDYLVITDLNGNVFIRAHEPQKFGDSISSQANIQKALRGENSVGIEEGTVVKYSIRAGAPLRDADGTIIGAVSLGYILSSENFVDKQKEILDSEVTIFYGIERIATTIQVDGKRITGTKLEHEIIIDTVLKKSQPYYGQATILGKNYSVAYLPIVDVNANTTGILFLGKESSFITNLIRGVMANLAIIFGVLGSVFAIVIILVIRIVLMKNLNYIIEILRGISQGKGDLTQKVTTNSTDELGTMAGYFNSFIENINSIVKAVMNETSNVTASLLSANRSMQELDNEIIQINTASNELSAGYEQTASSIIEVNEISSEIKRSAEFISTKAEEASITANAINNRTNEINSNIITAQETASKMMNMSTHKLTSALHDVQSIEQIKILTNAILEIAEQTNLLSLNASIEAARAGEAGKGFTVVAEEIRKLADHSANTASQIKEVVQNITESVNTLANNSQELLNYVSNSVSSDYHFMLLSSNQYKNDASVLNNVITEFSAISEELFASVHNIADLLEKITGSAQDGAQETELMAQRVENIKVRANEIVKETEVAKNSAEMLSSLVKQFRVK